MKTIFLIGFLLAFTFHAHPLGAASQTAPPESSSVKDLNTPRSFPEVASPAEWQARARQIRQQVLVSCGLWPMPDKTPLQAHVFGKIERDGYSVEKVYFQTLPGFYLGGNLYRPLGQGKGPFPAILNPHGHWENGRLADNKDGSIAARCISFARQGMLAFSYDMVGFNDTRWADAPTNRPFYEVHRQFATDPTNLLWNISLMGLQTWDSIRALDFLASLPEADRRRLACTGESGGGTQTFTLGAVEDRLAAQVPVVMVSHTMQGGCLCENAPGLRVEYSNMELAAAAAPRPQMLVAATGDWTKDTPTVEGPAIAHIYQLFNAADRFHYVRFDFGHNYNQTSREAVYAWLGARLLGQRDPARFKELPYQKEPDRDLRVWPEGVLPADAATEAQLIGYLVRRAETRLQALTPRTKRGLKRFKEVMLPAWKHTLQVAWPMSGPRFSVIARSGNRTEYALQPAQGGGGGLQVACFQPATASAARAVVLVSAEAGRQGSASAGGAAPAGLAAKLLENGCAVFILRQFSTGAPPNQFTNFYTVYNRTEAQERVRDLARVCAFARHQLKAGQVVLCGRGRAGLWALLAAPAADGVVADCDALDVSSDEALLAPDLFCPGLRALGAFEGAAMLAAPHPLLLHHTGSRFAIDSLRSTYQGSGAGGNLRIEPDRLEDESLVEWVCR
ncbi:MAG: acetylxylan esterase [Verrucomicrobiota bacterium]